MTGYFEVHSCLLYVTVAVRAKIRVEGDGSCLPVGWDFELSPVSLSCIREDAEHILSPFCPAFFKVWSTDFMFRFSFLLFAMVHVKELFHLVFLTNKTEFDIWPFYALEC